MRFKTTLLSHCALPGNSNRIIAVHGGEQVDSKAFCADVNAYVTAYAKLQSDNVAIYFEDAYPFCVNLFALLHAGKQVWLGANNKTSTAEKLIIKGCLLLGDWLGKELSITLDGTTVENLEPLNLNSAQLTIFTSGSSGEPKTISKSLKQFQAEINFLEQQWGYQLGKAQVLATVSHQHIYGLLFRVLWPLAAARCFYSEMFLSPESLLKAAQGISAYWVASPAQLKRLDDMSPWEDLNHLKVLFSSGGALALEVARKIDQSCHHKVIEVYGSSETGGIAWRQSVDDILWTPFKGISIHQDKNEVSHLSSPFLAAQTAILLDDKINLHKEGRFELLGRVDRIVKVEEKRLSLDELEHKLDEIDWVHESYTLLLADKRDKIAAVLVLTDSGKNYQQQQGREALIKQIRKQLMATFETLVLPRKWLFMQQLPHTTQAKIDTAMLIHLLSLDSTHYPLIQQCDRYKDKIVLQLKVSSKLLYFSGHFPQHPIVPGVSQLAWVERLGKILFNIESPFLRMEVIKFKKIIRPMDLIQMELIWKNDIGKLYFELSSITESFSSGRMVYRVH